MKLILIVFILTMSIVKIFPCSGQTFVVMKQSFVGEKGEIMRYTAYDQKRPDIMIIVRLQAGSMSIKVGESYVVGIYMLSDIRKEPQMTADSLKIYTFKATDMRSNESLNIRMQYNPFENWAIITIPYKSDGLIKNEVLSLMVVEKGEQPLVEMY